MDCFSCKKNCVMKTRKYMNVTPCMACRFAVEAPGWICKGCLANEKVCNFVEREK